MSNKTPDYTSFLSNYKGKPGLPSAIPQEFILPKGTSGPTKAARHNAGKLLVGKVCHEWIKALAEVATFGANKYPEPNPRTENWKKSLNTADHEDFTYDRKESAKRHIILHDAGERRDPASGLFHLAHAAWNLLAVLYYDLYQSKKG